MNYQILDTQIVTIEPLIRGSNREQRFNAFQSIQNQTSFTGLTDAKISFELKKTIEGGVIFEKKTANLGGSDTQVSVIDDSSFSIFFEPSDTESLVVFTYKGIIRIETTTSKIYKIYIDVPII
jgi:hypothetical protein